MLGWIQAAALSHLGCSCWLLVPSCLICLAPNCHSRPAPLVQEQRFCPLRPGSGFVLVAVKMYGDLKTWLCYHSYQRDENLEQTLQTSTFSFVVA